MPGGCPRTKELMDDNYIHAWPMGINNFQPESEGRTLKLLVFES